MDKQEIQNILISIDMDLLSLIDNLAGDSQNAPASNLKTSVLISVEHLRVDLSRIKQIKDLLKQD